MKKSKEVVLTLLSTIALAACSNKEHVHNPYDDYSWAGRSGDTGMMYTHYENGFFRYYLISRMFDGYGYNRFRYYRDNDRDRNGNYYGYHGGGSGVRIYSSYSSSGSGLAGSHATIGRGGFGGNGMTHGIGG